MQRQAPAREAAQVVQDSSHARLRRSTRNNNTSDYSLRHQQQDTTKMPWSPQPQMARTKASHIRLPAEPAEHRVVAGTLTNRRRMGQESASIEADLDPQRSTTCGGPRRRRPDGTSTARARRRRCATGGRGARSGAGAGAGGAVPTGRLGPPRPPRRLRLAAAGLVPRKAQTGGRPRPRADKFVAKSIVRNNGGALRPREPELKGDRDVVLAAVRNSGRALEHASPALRNDAAVVKVGRDPGRHGPRLPRRTSPCDPDVRDRDGVAGSQRLGEPKRSPTKCRPWSSARSRPAGLARAGEGARSRGGVGGLEVGSHNGCQCRHGVPP